MITDSGYRALKSMHWGYAAGVAGVLVGALCGSTAGILIRHVEQADGWQVLFYRSVTFALTVFLFMVLQDGRRLRKRFLSVGPLGIVVAVCLGGAFIAYILSLLLTTVANAVLILSASPFFTAIMARTFLGERTCCSITYGTASSAFII